jgi:type IV pilus assembly protein PilV
MRMRAKQEGVMLIEALIGILIFSIGILALIGMQAVAMKNTNDARFRSEASFLATQIVGTMWADVNNLARYDKDFAGTYANRDNWVATVEARLPGINVATNTLVPVVEVGPDAGLGLADNEVRVIIQWLQPGETQSRRLEMLNRINGAV